MIFRIHDNYPSRGNESAILVRKEPVVYGSAADGPLDAEALSRFDECGYLTFPAMLGADEVAGLYEEMQALRTTFSGTSAPEVITERDSGAVRSVFDVHRLSEVFARLARHPKLLAIARQILGSAVYMHQSRINYKDGFFGKEFYWHSDFETWHIEDGMPAMRAVSCAVALTENSPWNGPLMLIPGSHRHFVACQGATPENHYQQSLKKQEYGVPDTTSLDYLAKQGNGIAMPTGPAGSVVLFDCNTMHGSNSNISHLPRSNVFMVYNSVENTLRDPLHGLVPRPEFIAARRNCAALEA